MKLIAESIIMNEDNFKERLYEMIEKIEIGYSFIKKDKNNKSKLDITIENAKNSKLQVKEIIEKVLLELKQEWRCFEEETKIIIKEYDNNYSVTLAVVLDLKLLVDWTLEEELYNIKNNMPIKIKRLNKAYILESAYGVYDNEWHLVTVEESLAEKLNIKGYEVNTLKDCIEYQKEDMIEEDYSLNVTSFFCIEDKKDYKIDYYFDNNIESYLIKNCHIENDTFIIELN